MPEFKKLLLSSAALLLSVAAVGLSGCQLPRPDDAGVQAAKPKADVPGYAEVVEKYNGRAGRVEQLWSRAIIEMTYSDANGRRKFEQGEGHLIYVKPDWVSLSMGKLGNTILWAGRDPLDYWLFVMGDEKVAYIGKTGKSDGAARHRLNIPISLDHIVMLSGLEELPADPRSMETASVSAEGNQLRVEVPESGLDMLIDPATWLPSQIRVFRDGRLELVSTLSRPDSVVIGNQPPGAYPTIQTRIQIDYANRKDTLVLFLSGMTDGVEEEKIKFSVFQFDTLKKLLKPDRVVDLDALGP